MSRLQRLTGTGRIAVILGLLLLLAACETPISVRLTDPRDVQRELTSNVISTGELSDPTRIVLQQEDLTERFAADPEGAIAALHRIATSADGQPDELFALAETSFYFAQASGKQPYYLAASVYAFAFLFPANPAQRTDEFDPRVRAASDIYNRGLTSAFATAARSRVDLRAGTFPLPFGSIDIAFDPAAARWGNYPLSGFAPADELHVTGLRNDYRRPGIGAPLAADVASAKQASFQLTPDMKLPVTALLRMNAARSDLAAGALHGTLTVYPAFEPDTVTIAGQTVPLEADTTSAFAYGLSDPKIWDSEFGGFLRGDYFDEDAPQLVGLEPYRPGEIPVVFIHGTGSSYGRWADLINDLQSDPVIRDHFQFWLFSYSTGQPTQFSALELRRSIEGAVHSLDPQGQDPAMQQIVLIGHSQGGLLAKFLVIDSGSKLWDSVSTKPIEDINVSPETRELLRAALFVKPVPQVKRVIFIATPQRGSFVAGSTIGQFLGRLVSLPLTLTKALAETLSGIGNASTATAGKAGLGSVWSMSPDNPGLQAFAKIPVSPDVSAHSIIAVQGDGPVETGNDGVVAYQSAHIDEAKSELVVRSSHSVQANPHTVAEVRRILLLHLAQACPQGCTPAAPVADAPPPAIKVLRPHRLIPAHAAPIAAPAPHG
jgi:pimeloyl-ACP methyl ester carboxylesterase